jgi:hypothetical protein
MKLNNFGVDAAEYKNVLSSFLLIMSKYKTSVRLFFDGMSNKRKLLFVTCNIILSIYIAIVFFFLFSSFGTSDISSIRCVIQTLPLALIAFYLVIFCCGKSDKLCIIIKNNQGAVKWTTVFSYGVICLFVLMAVFAINFPGLKSPDTENQLNQVQNFQFDNWHPVIHTLMIWIITRICNHYAFVIFSQILLFSCAVGCLIATLESWGYSKKYLLLLGGFIIFNPSTHGIMMYAWKDTALTIIITFLADHMINIYLSGGKWLSRFRNIFAFSFCTGLIALVRHNGIFFSVPLLFLLVFLYIKRNPKVIFAIAASLAIIFSIRFPLYSALDVTYPDNTYIESVGIPMTIMGDVLVKNPAALSPETRDFLYRIAPEEEWRKKYIPGNYNSIKFQSNAADVIRTVPVKKFFEMTFDTMRADMRNSFLAFRDVTSIVWEIFGGPQVISVPSRESLMEETNILQKILKICLFGFEGLLSCIPPLSLAMTKTGWQMLALLLAGIVSCYRNGGKALILIIPSIMYNIGTMLLLCSSDIRFFHFNTVISLAFVLVLLGKNDAQGISK